MTPLRTLCRRPARSAVSTARPARRDQGARLGALLLALALAWPPGPGTALAALPSTDAVRLPAMGESASDEFNIGKEKRLGEQIMREIRVDPDYFDDPPLLDYLQSVWQPLVAAARQRGDIGPDIGALYPFEPFLVRDRSVNAFALPGGYIGVHLALIAMTTSRDELASVLAHELSHITQRHIARSISASQRSSTLGMAAMLLALIAAGRAGSADAANAAIVGGQAAMVQQQLNFSRDMEREADRNGIGLLSAAGFAPGGMAAMFEKLDQANHFNDNGSYPYLRSHPLTVERIGEAKARLDSLPAGAAQAPALGHTLMRERARVLMDRSTQAMQRLQAQGQEALAGNGSRPDAERLAALYAGALAALQLRDWAGAERAASAAQALNAAAHPAEDRDGAGRRALAQLQAEVALARGDAARATQWLSAAPADRTRAGLMLRGQVALVDARPEVLRASADALQVWLADHRQDAGVWQLLAQTAERQGQLLRAVRAQGEARAALGDLRGAIDRMRAGQLLAQRGAAGTDFIEASVIDARLRDLNAERRAQWRDEQGARRGGAAGEGD